MKYTLLEITENYKRLKNLPPVSVFDYLEESIKEHRSVELLNVLRKQIPWMYTGILFACSDVYMLQIAFKKAKWTDVKYKHGASSPIAEFKKLVMMYSLNEFGKKERIDWIVDSMEASLSKDDYDFMKAVCISTVSPSAIEAVKKYVLDIDPDNKEFFIDGFNTGVLDNTAVSFEYIVPLKNPIIVIKINNTVLDFKGKVLDYRIDNIAYPEVCLLVIEDNVIVGIITDIGCWSIKPVISNRNGLHAMLQEGYTQFLDCHSNGFVSGCVSFQNKSLKKEKVKFDTYNIFNIPIENKIIKLAQCNSKKNIISVNLPSSFEDPGDLKELNCVVWNESVYYAI